MTIYDLLQLLLLLVCVLIVIAFLAYCKHAAALDMHRHIHKELRDAAPWADPKKVRRVYRKELRENA